MCFYTRCTDVRIKAGGGQETCPKSHSKSEVELSYQCKIVSLVTCGFMSFGLLIRTRSISPFLRDFVLRKKTWPDAQLSPYKL